jgi:hypothetical protein
MAFQNLVDMLMTGRRAQGMKNKGNCLMKIEKLIPA